MARANEKIRSEAKRRGVFLWEIAGELHISVATITNWLHFPLNSEKERMVMDAIEKIACEKGE